MSNIEIDNVIKNSLESVQKLINDIDKFIFEFMMPRYEEEMDYAEYAEDLIFDLLAKKEFKKLVYNLYQNEKLLESFDNYKSNT